MNNSLTKYYQRNMGKCTSKQIRQISRTVDHIEDIFFRDDEKLRSVDITEVPDIFYQDQSISALVIDVYDGDTITVIFFVGDEPVQIKVRLLGIDTPEVKSGKGKFKAEKIAGKHCRDYLNSLIGNTVVNLVIHKWGKYGGRVIGSVSINDKDVSQLMISNGFALPYDGGKKHKWTQRELKQIIGLRWNIKRTVI